MNDSHVPHNPTAITKNEYPIVIGDTVHYDTQAYADYMEHIVVNPGTAKVIGICDNRYLADFEGYISLIHKSICWK